MAQTVKCLPTMQETHVQCLGQEDLLDKKMAPHSSILAWKIPWTEQPGRLQSMGSRRVGHDWATSLYTYTHLQNFKVSKTQIYTIPKDECVSIFSSSIDWGQRGAGGGHSFKITVYSKILLILHFLFLSPNKFRRLSVFSSKIMMPGQVHHSV